MTAGATPAYSDFAVFYDRLWGPRQAARVGPGLIRCLRERIASAHPVILDLACGTGHTAQTLIQAGFAVFGVDASPRMIELARINAPSAVLAEWRFGEALPDFGVAFDGTLCLFDSLNYARSLAEVGAVFRAVSRVLRPRGPFIVDVNTAAGHAARWRDTVTIVEDWGVCVCRFSADRDRRTARMAATGFLPRGDASWRRFDELHEQISLERHDLVAAARASGFAVTRVMPARDLGISREIGRLWLRAER